MNKYWDSQLERQYRHMGIQPHTKNDFEKGNCIEINLKSTELSKPVKELRNEK